LVTNKDRIKHIYDLIESYAKGGNTLVLIDRIATGDLLKSMNPDWVFINGGVKGETRQEEYDSISDSDNKVIVATYGVAAVGINIPRIFNLIMLEPGKSFIRVIQSIGRGIRKAEDKDYVRIVDLTSSLKYSKRHLTKRKKFYKDQKFPFKVHKVKYD
jgi:superfamily II DNA or RNA helicase